MGWAESEWGEITVPEIPGKVFVKATEIEGRLCVTAVQMELEPPATLTHAVLLRLPIGQIESILNQYGNEMREAQEARDTDFRLTRGPDGWRLTDDFLRDVARAYRAAVARGEWPNASIAQQVKAEPRTVEGWVRRARAAKYLPPGRRGVAG
jgi:hypothetical protein